MKWLCCLSVMLLLSGCTRAEETVASMGAEWSAPTVTVQPVAVPTAEPQIVERVPYVGRFTVAAVGIDVACYNSAEQAVVDAADSAAYFDYGGHKVIADHVNQSFGGLSQCVAGDRAQLETEWGVENYACVAVINGHNTGYDLTDENYVTIEELYPDTLVCYTCSSGWQNVTISFFEPISAPPTALVIEGE